MRDLPADSLINLLVELRLCTPAEVHRARSAVRRMTRDLPAFDSVWIDALAQSGALTPFQARWLEDNPPERLIAGEFILLDGLEAGLASRTFLAAANDRRRKVALKRLTPQDDHFAAVEERLQQFLERCRAIGNLHLALPTALIRQETSLLVVSPYVAGATLSELLIRRGRFPARIVTLLADQMLSALTALHAAGLTHGDVRLAKLRLTNRGTTVLVDAGVKPALSPELLVHAVQSPEEADVVAPERIGTNLPPTAASDLYAAGCVLWQLLAGRSPHPPADPLTKLAAHQTRRIPDVREFAPDTPAVLAELVHQLTSPNPQERPQSAEAARHRLGIRCAVRSGTLAAFRRQFDGVVPHLATRRIPQRHGWQAVAAAVLLCGMIAAALSDRGLRGELLAIAQRPWSPAETAPGSNPNTAAPGQVLQDIPEPDSRGVIMLTTPGPYAVRDLTAVGALTIQAASGVRPEIRIVEEPLRITAQRVTLSNLRFDGRESSWSESKGMIELKTQRSQIVGCEFRTATQSSSMAAVAWEPIDRRDPQAGQLEVKSTVFFGSADALRCATSPRRINWRNVLKAGPGRGVVVSEAAGSRGLKLELDHVTLRGSGSLLACAGPLIEEASASRIEIEAVDCVFDVSPSAPLVELLSQNVRPDWPEAFRVVGDGSVLKPDTLLLASIAPEDGSVSPLESEELLFEGLFPDAFEFAGPLSDDPADSALVKTQAPRRESESLPGVDVNKLPRNTK